MENICSFKLAKISETKNFELTIKQISNLTNLTSLSLDLSSNSIGDSGVNYLTTTLIKLINLSSLSLDLSDNSIGK